jgi:hypothetical protein
MNENGQQVQQSNHGQMRGLEVENNHVQMWRTQHKTLKQLHVLMIFLLSITSNI